MKESPLIGSFAIQKAEIGEYHGWNCVRSFGDVDAEFEAALAGRGVVDHSMFGRIKVTGPDRIDLLHRLSTNALAQMASGDVVSTLFVTDKGRLIDQVQVAALDDSLLLLCSPGAEAVLTHWIEKYTITEDVKLATLTDSTVTISLIGDTVISSVCNALNLPARDNHLVTTSLAGAAVHIIQSTDSRWSVARIVTANAAINNIYSLLDTAVTISGGRWIGSAAFEAYRISRGIAAYPGEISELFNPLEIGLRASVSFTKGCYIGQEVVARLDTYGKVRRHLSGIVFHEAPPDARAQSVLSKGQAVGVLTSTLAIPLKGKYVGLGVVREDLTGEGATIEVQDSRQTGGTLMNCPIMV